MVALSAELTFYSVDAALRGGNSGGPVLNDIGQLIEMAVFDNSSEEAGNYASNVEDIHKAYEDYLSQ